MQSALVALAVMRLALRLELGPEYDSNANHVREPAPGSEDVRPASSFLARVTTRGRLTWSNIAGSSLRLNLDLGGRFFFASEAVSQDVAVLRFNGDVRTPVGRATTLSLSGDYHETFQFLGCGTPPHVVDPRSETYADKDFCHRDFRLAAVRGAATVRDGAAGITFEAGARSYQWKPDDDLSFLAAGAAVIPSWHARSGRDGEHEWSASIAGRVEWRRYAGRPLLSVYDLAPDTGGPRRADAVTSLGANVSYFGRLYAALGWLVETDRSSSYDGSYLYQAVTLDVAAPLPSRFTLAGRAQFLFFKNGFLPISVAVEDENRNAFSIEMARDFAAGLTLRARYSLFYNAPGDERQAYTRHLASLLVTWQGQR